MRANAILPGMRVFGLTGNIGSGKSTVAAMLREAGIPVLDADRISLTRGRGDLALEPGRDLPPRKRGGGR